MDQREKLIELLCEAKITEEYRAKEVFTECSIMNIADYLLANGVVVVKDADEPPCSTCDHGWGSASVEGIKTCNESCHELEEYNAKRKSGCPCEKASFDGYCYQEGCTERLRGETQMRLVDVDELKRNVVSIGDAHGLRIEEEMEFSESDVIGFIDNAPTIDAVPVVRCIECKFREHCKMSGAFKEIPPDDWFCADGKRKDGTE